MTWAVIKQSSIRAPMAVKYHTNLSLSWAKASELMCLQTTEGIPMGVSYSHSICTLIGIFDDKKREVSRLLRRNHDTGSYLPRSAEKTPPYTAWICILWEALSTLIDPIECMAFSFIRREYTNRKHPQKRFWRKKGDETRKTFNWIETSVYDTGFSFFSIVRHFLFPWHLAAYLLSLRSAVVSVDA